MTFGLYTYGDPEMGVGHIYRCLRLAKEAQHRLKLEPHFFLKAGAAGRSIIEQSGYPWHGVEQPGELSFDQVDVLIVDQLQTPVEEMQALRSQCNILVSMDDVGQGHFHADLGFNGLYKNPQPAPSQGGKWYFGLDYIVIDPAFASTRRREKANVENLLLTQGGADTYGVLPTLVNELSPWLAENLGLTLHVHTGPAFEHQKQLDSALSGLTTPWQQQTNIKDMAALYADMDIAISAAGMIACELVAAGVPCLLTTQEHKELETAQELEKCGAAISLGYYDQTTCEALLSHLRRLAGSITSRQTLSRQAQRSIDAKGAERIINEIRGLL